MLTNNPRIVTNGIVGCWDPLAAKASPPDLLDGAGNFGSASDWNTATSPWTISSGTASIDGSQSSYVSLIKNSVFPVANVRYRVKFTMTRLAGTLHLWANGSDNIASFSASGTYDRVYKPNVAGSFYFEADPNFYGTVTNATITREPPFLEDLVGGADGTMYTGTCLDFDETDDYIASASGVAWGVGRTWTISWWMYMDSSALQTWFSLKQATPDYNKIEIITNNGIREIFANMVDDDGTVMQIDTDNGVWNTGEWTHVAITNNGNATTLNAIDFYINGALVSKNLLNGATQTPMTNTARTLNIGQEVGTGRNVDGKMADIRFYSVALSANNVKEIYEDSKVIIPNNVSQTDLKLWWPLMEGAGVVAYDGSGNGNHGDIINDSNWTISDPGCPQLITGYNGPMLFDADGYVGTSLTLNAVTDYTFSWWSRHTSQNNPDLFTSGGSSTGAFNLNWAGSTDRPILYLAGSNYAYFSDNAAQDDGQWHHWLLTYEGTATSGREAIESKLYIDGVNQSITSAATTAAPTTWGTFRIGRAGSGGTFSGDLNEFIIYNGQLGSSDRAALYVRGPNGGPLPPDPMSLSNSSDILAYWRNDGKVTWADRSGNGYTGTVGGSPSPLLFKQGYNGSASTSTGRDGQGFPLFYENNGAVGFTQLSGSKVTILHSSDILWDINANFTIITWYKIGSNPSGTYPSIWGKGGQSESGPGYELFLNPGGTSFTLRGTWAGGPTWGMNAAYGSAGNPMDGNWHCVTVAIDRDNPTTGGKLYQDNVIQSAVNISGLGDTTNTVNLTLASAGAGLFHGQIAGAQIYNRVLTTEELTQNFDAQRSRFGV